MLTQGVRGQLKAARAIDGKGRETVNTHYAHIPSGHTNPRMVPILYLFRATPM